jgi:phage shock protein PspC (stress-responsive transcriptional regulator)
MIAGVCAGLSECFGINLIFARFVFVLLGLANGLGVVLYLILILVIPARSTADAASARAVCPPPSSRKTILAYIAGAVSICAALLTFVDNLSSIVAFIDKWITITSGDSVSDESYRAASVVETPVTSFDRPQPSQEINAVQGVASVGWKVDGVIYVGDIRMDGSFGLGSIVFRDPYSRTMIEVQQNLAIKNIEHDVLVIGSNPSRSDYYPDIFRLAMTSAGYLDIVEVCDSRECNHVDSANGRFQIMSGNGRL